MSLTAYNGLMTKKSLKYIQEETIKRIEDFKEASLDELADNLSNDIVEYFDGIDNIVDSIEFYGLNEKNILKELRDIDKSNISVFSYLKRSGRILSKSQYSNMFKVHLKLTIEFINNKYLIYPNILVNKHKNILLEYLNDWYCQNQCDPDENVDPLEWKERENDWYVFNENEYFENTINLFNPNNYSSNILRCLDEKFIDKILKKIPNRTDRLFYKGRKIMIDNELKNISEKDKVSYFMDRRKELYNNKGIVYDYINKNNIDLIEINKELLTKKNNLNEF